MCTLKKNDKFHRLVFLVPTRKGSNVLSTSRLMVHILTSYLVILRASVWTWPHCQAWSLPVKNRKLFNNRLRKHRLTGLMSQRRSGTENLSTWSAAAGQNTLLLYHLYRLRVFLPECSLSKQTTHRVLVWPYSLFDLVGSLALASRSLWFFVNTHSMTSLVFSWSLTPLNTYN